MEQKLIDLIGEAVVDEIDELSDEEMDFLTQEMDLEQIQQVALSRIKKETSELLYLPKRKRIKQWLLCAVLAASLISGTLIAKQYISKFAYFWGEEVEIPAQTLVSIGSIQDMGELNMQFKEAIVSGNQLALIISFTKKDGSQFDETARVNFVMNKWDGDEGGSKETKLSKDQTELLCLYKIRGKRNVKGERIKFIIDTVYEIEKFEEEWDIALDEVYAQYPIVLAYEKGPWDTETICRLLEQEVHKQRKKYPVDLPLQERFPAIQMDGVSFVEGNLRLNIHSYWTEEEKALGVDKSVRTEATIIGLRDIRNNKIYEADKGHAYLEKDEKGVIYTSEFEGILLEDLQYLKPIVQYEIIHPLADGEWEYEWIVTGGEEGFLKSLKEEAKYQIGDIKLEQLHLSATGLVLTGKGPSESKAFFDEPTIRILTKDKEWITLMNLSAGNSGGNVTWQYEVSENPIIDLSNVSQIAINDWIIDID